MPDNSRRTIQALLASSNKEDLHQGLKMVKQEISRVGSDEARDLFEVLSTLFYFDPIERPDLSPILEEALNLVVGFGKWIVPALLEKLDGCDFKSQLAIANALGRIGADAIEPMIREFQRIPDSDRRAFITYALGKIKSPHIAEAAPMVLQAARSSHTELRDAGTRSIGKIAESIPCGALTEDLRRSLVEQLLKNLACENTGIRSKAMRSLGKLAKYGHLSSEEKGELKDTCEEILGGDSRFEWDPAYIVRREAQEALQYVRAGAATPAV
jgi:hypothetical protein